MKSKLTIVKAGGRVLDTPEELNKLVREFIKIEGRKVLVHGGGVFINDLCNQLNIETRMVDGRRVTSEANMDVVLMACAGKLNKNLVSTLNKNGQQAIGLTGGDLNIIESRKRSPYPINYGQVGDITKVNTKWLIHFIDAGVVPVMASVTQSNNFELLNTNADTIASALASELSKHYEVELFFYFDKSGVLTDASDNNSKIDLLDLDSFLKMKQQKSIHTGMLPKLHNGFLALKEGVNTVSLGNSVGNGTVLSI